MKKVRTILAVCLVIILCFSLCACSGIVDMAKSVTYNTGELKDGFSYVKTIDGVEFAVPSALKDKAKGETEFMATLFEAMEDDAAAEEFAKGTYELKDSTTYALVNYSVAMIMVTPMETNGHLSSVDDAKDVEGILEWDADNMDLEIGNSYLSSNLNDVTKVICPVTCEVEGTDGREKTLTYKGYIALIENKDNDVYCALAISLNENDDDMKYIAKSLAYNGEKLAEPEEDEDNEVFIPNDENIGNQDEGSTIVPPQPTVDTETKPQTPNGDFKEDLSSFKFQMDGQTVAMPMPLNEFLEKFDLVVEDEYKEVTLDSNEYTFITVEKKNDSSHYMFVDIANTSKEGAKSVYDCVVFCLEADKYDLYDYDGNPKFDIVLPCGVVINKTTKEQVLSAYGTPDEVRDTAESNYIYYKWDLSTRSFDYYSFMEVTVEKATGIVMAFEYSTMP